MRTVIVVAIVAALTACNGAPAEPAEGFARYEGEGFAFDYPSGWQVDEDPGDPDKLVQISGPEGDGLPPVIALTNPDRRYDIDEMRSLYLSLTFGAQVRREILSEEDYEVEGATEARLIDATFEVVLKDGGRAPVRQRTLLVVTDDASASFGVAAPVDEFDDYPFDEILRSFTAG